MKKRNLQGIGFYLLILIIMIMTIYMLHRNMDPQKISYADLVRNLHSRNIEEASLQNNTLTIVLKGETTPIQVHLSYPAQFLHEFNDEITEQINANVIKSFDYRRAVDISKDELLRLTP